MNEYDPWRRPEAELYPPTRTEYPAAAASDGDPYAATQPLAGNAGAWAPTTPTPLAQPSQSVPTAPDPTATYAAYPGLPEHAGSAPEAGYSQPYPTQPYPQPQRFGPPQPYLPGRLPQPYPQPQPYPPSAQPGGWYPVAYQPVYVSPKSSGVAYLLWFFFGLFGAHHFYLGRSGWGIAYLLSTVLLGWLGIGLLFVMIGCLIDLFLIPGYTREANRRLTGYPY